MKYLSSLLILLSLFACNKAKKNNQETHNNVLYQHAAKLYEQNPDSAYYYFSKLATTSKDTILLGKAYLYMSIIQCDQGDYIGAEEMAVSALRYCNSKTEFLHNIYNTIAIAKDNVKDFEGAIKWYKKAIANSTEEYDRVLYENNLSVSLTQQKRYEESIGVLEPLLNNAEAQNDKGLLSKIIDNLHWTKSLKDPHYNPVAGFLKSLAIRKADQDLWGQNASYAHLSDYYYRQGQSDMALLYAKLMLDIAAKIKSDKDQLEAYEKLIKLSSESQSRQYFEIYKNLADKIQLSQNNAKNQFALIRYETEKHKSDNLKLQQDNTEKTYQLLISIVSLFLISIGAIFWYRKRKQHLALESQKLIKENQLKTSKKVHDVVANGLYKIMSKLENQIELHDETILDEMESLYEKSRDISYEGDYLEKHQFEIKIQELLQSFASNDVQVLIVGNEPEIWENVPTPVKFEVEHILQELMVNMKKHSQANRVVMKFDEDNNWITISYTDNGIGIADGTKFNNGLTNTGNRINSIKGQLTFEPYDGKGLKLKISFPRN